MLRLVLWILLFQYLCIYNIHIYSTCISAWSLVSAGWLGNVVTCLLFIYYCTVYWSSADISQYTQYAIPKRTYSTECSIQHFSLLLSKTFQVRKTKKSNIHSFLKYTILYSRLWRRRESMDFFIPNHRNIFCIVLVVDGGGGSKGI